MKRGEGGGGNRASETRKSNTVGAYAVQCEKCFKWRLVPTKEEYETIRHKFTEDPWHCSRKLNVSCDDPADLEYDNSRLWVIDKPDIPKTPNGLERNLVMRGDFSKMDVHYVMPNGKKVRCPSEIEKFLKANPQYKDQINPSELSFTVPRILDDMIPSNSERGSAKSNKQSKKMKTEDEEDVALY